MKEYILNYYQDFKCIAGKCQHTCCAGWEMLIDQESLSKYQNDLSPFSQTLKSGINFKKSKFKTDKNKRCAFLSSDGLCDIITNLGENSLCQVCRDHPRFRSFFDDRTEMGLGFSCEQATNIILSYEHKILPVLVSDDNDKTEPSLVQKYLLEFRERALDLVQNRNKDITIRIYELLSLCKADFSENDFNKILKLFLSLERLDKNWTKRLKTLKNTQTKIATDNSLSIFAEQFLVNSLFRHLYDAEDTMSARARTLSCIFSWWIIKNIFENEKGIQNDFDKICDIVRAYSSEVEYSQKNLNKLFNFSYNFIKI